VRVGRHLLGLLVATFAFFGAGRSAALYRKHYAPFRLIGGGRAEHSGKFHAVTYEHWDGQLVTLYCFTFDSGWDGRGLDVAWSDVIEILETSAVISAEGKRVGERREVVLRANGGRGRDSAVVVVNGLNMYVLFGESRRRVLEFEEFQGFRRHNLTGG
jgi:hypothetical protein